MNHRAEGVSSYQNSTSGFNQGSAGAPAVPISAQSQHEANIHRTAVTHASWGAIMWAIEHGCCTQGCTHTPRVCNGAARGGHLEVLQWATFAQAGTRATASVEHGHVRLCRMRRASRVALVSSGRGLRRARLADMHVQLVLPMHGSPPLVQLNWTPARYKCGATVELKYNTAIILIMTGGWQLWCMSADRLTLPAARRAGRD